MGPRISKLSGQDTPVLKRVSSASTPLLNNSPPDCPSKPTLQKLGKSSMGKSNDAIHTVLKTPVQQKRRDCSRNNISASTPHLPALCTSPKTITSALQNEYSFVSNNLSRNNKSEAVTPLLHKEETFFNNNLSKHDQPEAITPFLHKEDSYVNNNLIKDDSPEVATPLLENEASFINNNLVSNGSIISTPLPKENDPLYENLHSFRLETPSPKTSTPKKQLNEEEPVYEEIKNCHTINKLEESCVLDARKTESIRNCSHNDNLIFPKSPHEGKVLEEKEKDASQNNLAINVTMIKTEETPIAQCTKKAVRERTPVPERCSKWTSTSIRKWLQDLYTITETECLSTLQGKDLTQYQFVRIAQEAIITLHNLTSQVAENFDQYIKELQQEQSTDCCKELCDSIKDLSKYYETNSTYLNLPAYKDRLKEICHQLDDLPNRCGKRTEIVLENFRKEIEKYTRILTSYNLQVIIQLIHKGNDTYSLKIAVSSLITLAEVSDIIRSLIAKVGGVQVLVDICLIKRDNSLLLLSLRTLSVVCSTPSTVERFVKSGGVECITSALAKNEAEEIRCEAAGLLTQITAPWMDKCGLTISNIKNNIIFITRSLIELVASTLSEESFLLGVSALANLSYLDSEACGCIKTYNAIQKLVSRYRQHNGASALFIKDQMSTLLANMATAYPRHVSENGGVILLLCFLQLRPSLMHTKAEISACERILQKSAIAISRLSSHQDISTTITEMQGIHRLVRLCKDRKERNHSDTVLIACLAAIKKISATQSIDVFRNLDAADLVESHLWDSFLIYSSKVKLKDSSYEDSTAV